jgi:hypothetical protein
MVPPPSSSATSATSFCFSLSDIWFRSLVLWSNVWLDLSLNLNLTQKRNWKICLKIVLKYWSIIDRNNLQQRNMQLLNEKAR